ncbi:hypothetical protein BJY01DRAFT_130309 [Aspergillus pseudoustus]|uniref:Zn(2)-C6 fungal-type domain-containing protein n=1 Tax=Aspergillus pseudoustus TaxID=1810923 RepID=A0ABR4KE91_9EURO
MVYCGRSRGCFLCRKRKIKCDEALPECGNCQIYGRPCPGYRLESIFRNETSKVEQLVKKTNSHPPGIYRGRGRDSTAPSLTLHHVADSTWEERAACYFFDQYTSVEEDENQAISHLSFLPSLYAVCRDNELDSPTARCLRHAVDATALIALTHDINAPSLALRAREYYGRALRGLRQALATQTQAVKDETLTTMVLLALFEDITGERNGLVSSHAAGFELLMKLRGQGQLGHAQGRDLFHIAYTHTHVEILALREKPRYDTDWIAESLNTADPVARLILVASKISQIFSAASSLQASAGTSTTTPPSFPPDAASQLSLLLLTCRQIELELTSWSQDLPDSWLPLVIYADKNTTREPLITYHHHSIAAIWAYYRAVRVISHIMTADLRRTLALATGDPNAFDEDPSISTTPATIQKHIADICRSIPFCVGDVDIMGNPTTAPSSFSSSSSEARPRARAFSAYSIIWPLWYILSCGFATPAQVEQLRACLARIGSDLGIRLALVLAENAGGQRNAPVWMAPPVRAEAQVAE